MTFTIVPIRCGDIVNHERLCFLYRKNRGSARLHAPCIHAWLLHGTRRTIVVDAGPGSRASTAVLHRGRCRD